MRTDNVIAKMAEIVERRMELYKGDFYDYDVKQMADTEPREFAWMVRTSGTHMMTDIEAERIGGEYWHYCYEIFKRSNTWFYYVRMNADGSGEVTLSEKRCDEFASRMARKRKKEVAA